jgi:transmembrane sensor
MQMHGDDASAYRDAFEHWRAADPRHRIAYARLERQWSQAALLSQTRIGRARALPQRRSRSTGAPIGYAMAAAVVVLVIGLGLWLHAPGMLPGQQAARQLASRVGEIRTLRLPDGSLVTLDTDSSVRVAFTADERRIELERGRARFNVTHNSERPFVVSAGNGAVVARGTVFDVSLIEGRISVTLLRGIVDVHENGQDKTGSPRGTVVQLHQGQSTLFAASEPPTPPRLAPTTESSWVSGMLSFDADRLGYVIAQANRYSVAKISVADPKLNELKITGAYHVRNASSFAQTLAASLNLTATPEPDGNITLSRPG